MNPIIDSIIEQSQGRFLTVTFRKKNGEIRTINGRVGVHYQDTPADHRFDAMAAGIPFFLVWSVRDRGYRRINAASVLKIVSQGLTVFVRPEAEWEVAA